MIFGLKVHHTDIDSLIYLKPDALEFALFPTDMAGEWVDQIRFQGPTIVHAPEKFADGTILDAGSEDEALRRKAVDMLRRTVDLSVKLHATTVIVHPGGVFRERKTISHAGLIRSMGELAAYADNRLELVLENMPGYYRTRGELWHPCLFTDLDEIISVLGETGLGMCLDVSHAKLHCNVKGVDFEHYLGKLLPYTRHFHLSDAAGIDGEGLQIGEGEINWNWLWSITRGLDLVAVPEIDDGFKDGGNGFRIARDRLADAGIFCR